MYTHCPLCNYKLEWYAYKASISISNVCACYRCGNYVITFTNNEVKEIWMSMDWYFTNIYSNDSPTTYFRNRKMHMQLVKLNTRIEPTANINSEDVVYLNSIILFT